MGMKTLFEVRLQARPGQPRRCRTLFVLADGEEDLRALREIGEGEILQIVARNRNIWLPGRSRVVGRIG